MTDPIRTEESVKPEFAESLMALRSALAAYRDGAAKVPPPGSAARHSRLKAKPPRHREVVGRAADFVRAAEKQSALSRWRDGIES